MHNSVFKKNRLIIVTIIVSVSFHLVVLYLMQQGSSSKPLKESNKTPKVKPLQAKLFFELPPQPVAPPIPEIQSESAPKQESVLIEHPAEIEKKVKQLTTPVVNKATTIEAPQKPQVKVKNTHEVAKPVIQKVDTSTKINSQFIGTAGKHVQQFNQQQDAKKIAESSRYYQQQKNSPIIHAPNPNRFVTEQEKMLNKTKIRANCDGASRKIASTLLSFMGGNVSCTRPSSINGFINKRINRENSLPAKYKKPLDVLPKSVVIQD